MSQNTEFQTIMTLVLQYFSGEEMDAGSAAKLEEWAKADVNNRKLLEQIADEKWPAKELYAIERIDIGRLRGRVMQMIEEPPAAVKEKRKLRFGWKAWAAAAAIIVITVSVYFFKTRGDKAISSAAAGIYSYTAEPISPTEVPSMTRGALKLADGRIVLLSQIAKGDSIKDGSWNIVRTGSNVLDYKTNNVFLNEPGYSTLSVPPGGRWQVKLPNGTRVWINAGGSMAYPLSNTGPEIAVLLDGEAYFEVEKNSRVSFAVRFSRMPEWKVVSLGTAFAVRAVKGEIARATLKSGQIEIRKGSYHRKLQPAEEGRILNPADTNISVSVVDTANRFAFKDGLFKFNGTDVPSAMKEVMQWYGAGEPVYVNGAENAIMGQGEINRNISLKGLLKGVSTEHLDFEVKNNKITVTRK